jgi:hypothetical protein
MHEPVEWLPADTRWRILFGHPEVVVLSSRRLSLIARLLSLALLVGQLGAETHAYTHLLDDTDGLPSTAQNCRACLSGAPLLSAVGSSPTAFIVARFEAEAFLPPSPVIVAQSPAHRAFQSRAPPALL